MSETTQAAQLLSEPEAWREIAERLARPDMEDFDAFICHQIDDLEDEGRLRCDPFSMRARIGSHLRLIPGVDPFLHSPPAYLDCDGTSAELRGARILAALWLALEAKEDAR